MRWIVCENERNETLSHIVAALAKGATVPAHVGPIERYSLKLMNWALIQDFQMKVENSASLMEAGEKN